MCNRYRPQLTKLFYSITVFFVQFNLRWRQIHLKHVISFKVNESKTVPCLGRSAFSACICVTRLVTVSVRTAIKYGTISRYIEQMYRHGKQIHCCYHLLQRFFLYFSLDIFFLSVIIDRFLASPLLYCKPVENRSTRSYLTHLWFNTIWTHHQWSIEIWDRV